MKAQRASRQRGALGTVVVLKGLVPDPALGVVTHLGFQFCDLQVQFIQVFVHESDECLEAPCGPILGTQQHAHRVSVFTYVQAYEH